MLQLPAASPDAVTRPDSKGRRYKVYYEADGHQPKANIGLDRNGDVISHYTFSSAWPDVFETYHPASQAGQDQQPGPVKNTEFYHGGFLIKKESFDVLGKHLNNLAGNTCVWEKDKTSREYTSLLVADMHDNMVEVIGKFKELKLRDVDLERNSDLWQRAVAEAVSAAETEMALNPV